MNYALQPGICGVRGGLQLCFGRWVGFKKLNRKGVLRRVQLEWRTDMVGLEVADRCKDVARTRLWDWTSYYNQHRVSLFLSRAWGKGWAVGTQWKGYFRKLTSGRNDQRPKEQQEADEVVEMWYVLKSPELTKIGHGIEEELRVKKDHEGTWPAQGLCVQRSKTKTKQTKKPKF